MKIFNKIITFVSNLSLRTKIISITAIVVVILVLCPIIWYNLSIRPLSSTSNKVPVKIDIGSGTTSIAVLLKDKGVIKSDLAFRIYIKLNKIDGLQAGDYTLDSNNSVTEIISVLKTGKVINDQTITFIEGKNMRWIAKKIAAETNNSEEDVFSLLKDSKYIDELIDIYWFLTDEIKNKDIYYPLEGYLFPDTYDFPSKSTSVKDIFSKMLDRMDEVLSEYKSYFESKKSKYSIHQLLSLASISELEGTNDADRKEITSVLYNRLDAGMSLGSDVTTYYAYKVDVGERDLYTSELYTYNPYNTRGPQMFGKLPVGPIASVSKSAIDSVIHPSDTDYLYFIADKNGKVYFSKTDSEHQKLVQNLKNKGLWYEY